jgi:hypothetical protein
MKRFWSWCAPLAALTHGLIGVLLLLLASCQARDERAESPFAGDAPEHTLLVIFDLSGSYAERVCGPNGNAYELFARLKDAYFRDQLDGQIILSQISARYDKALLWQGKPRDFARAFPTPQSFKDFLKSKSDPNGSPVWSSVSDGVEHLVRELDGSPKQGSMVLCFSDFEDNDPRPGGKERFARCLKEYGKRGGSFGAYWVAQQLIPELTQTLRDSGVKFRIEPEFAASVTLPTFD